MEGPLDWAVPVRPGVEEVVDDSLHPDQFEERDLEEVHWDIELEHERRKDCIAIVQDCYDEDTDGGGGEVGEKETQREGGEREGGREEGGREGGRGEGGKREGGRGEGGREGRGREGGRDGK